MVVQLSMNNKFFLFFIIVFELLSISIHDNFWIKGIIVDGNEIKLVTFADDMTSFVRDKQSHITLLDVIKSFGRYSELMINQDKMKAFYLEITHQIA